MLAVIISAGGKRGMPSSGSRKSGRLRPSCGTGHSMILSAQQSRPCLLPASPRSRRAGALAARTSQREASLSLDSDRAGPRASRNPHCDLRHLGRPADPSDQPGTRRFERPLSLVPQYSDSATTPSGGCAPTASASLACIPILAAAVDGALPSRPGLCWSNTSGAPRAFLVRTRRLVSG